MESILTNIIVQLIYFVVVVFVAGFLISLLNRLFYRIVKQQKAVCYATGFIGTPIHELSHALLCLVFLHRIDEIKLFQFDDGSGVLGYVNHSYNKRNVYQQMGNYFIGIAPILVGTLIVFFSTQLLLPDAFVRIGGQLSVLAGISDGGISWNSLSVVFQTLGVMIGTVFGAITTGWQWWLFILIVFCIALHMNLSGADIKGSLRGLPFVILILVVLNLALGFFGGVYRSFTSFMNLVGSYLMGTLLLSLIFSAICILIALLIRGIIELVSLIRKGRRA